MKALYRSLFAKGRILNIPIAVSIEIRIAFISLRSELNESRDPV